MKLLICPESEQDYSIIHAIEEAAFGRQDEALLVKALREAQLLQEGMSLVAWWKDYPIAHLLFCSLQVEVNGQKLLAVSLGPVAVVPEFQKRGVGSQLIQKGLAWMCVKGFEAVTVLGEPAYYQRFGFSQELGRHFDSPYAGEHFMALELQENKISQAEKWKVVYPKAFEGV